MAARVALAVGFAVVGIVAFVDPGKSFDALATIFAFYLLLRGLFELIAAFASRGRGSSVRTARELEAQGLSWPS